jgi:hypothetical protein
MPRAALGYICSLLAYGFDREFQLVRDRTIWVALVYIETLLVDSCSELFELVGNCILCGAGWLTDPPVLVD